MLDMPSDFAAGTAHGHDPGDEDPGETAARQQILCARQLWKCDTFPLRMYAIGYGPGGMREPPDRHSLDSDDYSARGMLADMERRRDYDVAILRRRPR